MRTVSKIRKGAETEKPKLSFELYIKGLSNLIFSLTSSPPLFLKNSREAEVHIKGYGIPNHLLDRISKEHNTTDASWMEF
ncbi:unnamed protein product [Rhizophagus irregularis]|nr:unnamed protein product [Rhizophagus irregularis]